MKKNRFVLKMFALLLAFGMVITMIPNTAMAAENNSTDGLKLSKTAELQSDGTYTINLEAYATGTVSTTVTTTTEVVPTDFVLVLDQSGSMTQNNMSGIPSGYTKVNSTPDHAMVKNGAYYVKDGDNYYRVNVDERVVESVTTWVGDNGNTYTDDQVSNTWTDHNGKTYTGNYYAIDTLTTWHRIHWREIVFTKYAYEKDGTNERSNKENSAAEARKSFETKNHTYPESCEFHNDGAPANGDTSADDPFYVAAAYVKVTKQVKDTKEYTYTYINGSGKVVTIGTYGENDKTTATLYTTGSRTGTRLQALQYAANKFISDIHANAVATETDHRIAVVGFASDAYDGSNSEYYYCNTELFVGATQYNYAAGGRDSSYNTQGNLAANQYGNALQSVRTDSGYGNLQASIANLAGKGGTHPDLGFEMANGIFEANQDTNRNRVIIFLTDGEPGDTRFNQNVANNTVSKANISKDTYEAAVYTVAVLDTEPENGGNVDKFLKNTSSTNSYAFATNAGDLDKFFETITNTTTSTEVTSSVTLDEKAYMLDVISSNFKLRSDAAVTAKIAKHVGMEAFVEATPAPAGITCEIVDGNKVKVSGFDYTAPENLVTTEVSGGSTIANGNKLIVTITGVEAKDSAVTGAFVSTNENTSGIYDTAENGSDGLIKPFEQPQFKLTEELFVLDYAKDAKLTVGKNFEKPEKLDGAEDKLFSKTTKNELTMKYGNAKINDTSITYSPKTMKWDGYDTFYALGSTTNQKIVYNWSRVSVIPATSVYYEDDFITNTNSVTVGIEYTGNWDVTGEVAGNTETPNNGVQGWIESKDDETYSDGSAHVAADNTAKATFSFTGTGVDIYSRTDNNVGQVKAKLYRMEADNEVLIKSLIVNNESASGTYYQIPTLGFTDLGYATYKVELQVRAKEGAEENAVYYLDGIRVYNPLAAVPDQTVDKAYASQKTASDAIFTTVRDILLADPEVEDTDTIEGAVFIDKTADAETGKETSSLAVYQEYGPKNEVYLNKNQSVAFKVDGFAAYYYIGLKAPEGTHAEFTNGSERASATINGASDQYYKIIPDPDGMVMIQNTGENLLSITKLCAAGFDEGIAEASVFASMTGEEAVAYANVFDTMAVSAYEMPIMMEEDLTEETPEIEVKPEEETKPESEAKPEEDSNTDDVDIENGTTEQESEQKSNTSWLDKFLSWFK